LPSRKIAPLTASWGRVGWTGEAKGVIRYAGNLL